MRLTAMSPYVEHEKYGHQKPTASSTFSSWSGIVPFGNHSMNGGGSNVGLTHEQIARIDANKKIAAERRAMTAANRIGIVMNGGGSSTFTASSTFETKQTKMPSTTRNGLATTTSGATPSNASHTMKHYISNPTSQSDEYDIDINKLQKKQKMTVSTAGGGNTDNNFGSNNFGSRAVVDGFHRIDNVHQELPSTSTTSISLRCASMPHILSSSTTTVASTIEECDSDSSFEFAYTMGHDEEFKYLQFLLGTDSDDKYLPDLSFRSIFGRTINNPEQVSVLEKYLEATRKICVFMAERGTVNIPGSYLWEVLNNKHELFPMSEHSHIYLEESSNKIGETSDGIMREKYYEKEFTTQPFDPKLISLIDLDKIDVRTQRMLVEHILELAKLFSPTEYPTTLRDALKNDRIGLPIYFQIRLRSLVKSAEDCKHCGGSIDVWGVLIAFVRLILESGLQMFLCEQGHAITGAKHEAVNNDITRVAAILDTEVLDNVQSSIEKIFSTEEEVQVASQSHELHRSFISWAPAKTKSQPKDFIPATVAIMHTIFKDNWTDPFKTTPYNGDVSSITEAYDAVGGYSDEDRREAIKETLQGISNVETDGGIIGCDTNDEAWKVTNAGNIVDYLTTEHETLLGTEDKWTIVHEYRGVTILKLKHKDDKLIRIIVVFRPLCAMMHYIPGETIEWHELKWHENAAAAAAWLYAFIKTMRNEGLVVNRSLDRRLEDNFAYLHAFFVGDVKFSHIYGGAAVQLMKNGLMGPRNINQPSDSGLMIKRDPFVFGRGSKRARRQVVDEGDSNVTEVVVYDGIELDNDGNDDIEIEEEDSDNKKPSSQRDKFFVEYILKKAQFGPTNATEAAAVMYQAILHDHFNSRLSTNAARYRFEKIQEMTRYIPEEILTILNKRWAAEHVVGRKRDENVNTLLRHYADTGDLFFVRVGATIDMPEENTELGVEPGKGFHHVRVVFKEAKFVPIAYSTLKERCKKSSAYKTDCSLSEYKVVPTKGIFRDKTPRTEMWVNSCNVVEVKLVRR
jgi:hypothetical protein